ncbi:MAG: pyridoxal phosphate-dependent aminotransferase [Blastocatellia bacterium]
MNEPLNLPRGLPWESGVNPLTKLLTERQGEGRTILDLTGSNPTRAGFVFPRDEILSALPSPAALEYHPEPHGLWSARAAVAAYYHECGAPIRPENVQLTVSTSEAYSWLFKLLAGAGDNVLIPQPGYPLFEYLAVLEHTTTKTYRLEYLHPHGWRVDFDSVLAAIDARTRAIVVVSPGNPTGAFIRPDELTRLQAIAMERGLALIVDEVFADYPVEPDAAARCLALRKSLLAEEGPLMFTLNGFSKTLALPQMKFGWIVAGGEAGPRARAMRGLELIADTYLSLSAPIQLAAPAWMQLRARMQEPILRRLHENAGLLTTMLADTPCRLLRCEGGWSAVIEVPRIMSEEAWTLVLLGEDNVLVHPGYFFDFPREAFLAPSLLTQPAVLSEAVARILHRCAVPPIS